MKILIINGPNLNMIGKREEKFYGREDFEKILSDLKEEFSEMEIGYFQSNSEGEMVSRIQTLEDEGYKGLVINAAAYSHYSIAIRDALEMLNVPRVEVHFSNIAAREPFRNVSVISAVCQGVISGFGKESYRLAVLFFDRKRKPSIGFNR